MPRTLLPRSALANSATVASSAPVDPAVAEQILGPAAAPVEPLEEPSSQPASQPSSQPGPQPPADPNPKVLLVHPPSIVIAAGLRGDAEGPIFARDPLTGAATLLVEAPLDFPKKISLYKSIGRLVVFMRRMPRRALPLHAGYFNKARIDFEGYTLPDVTESVEFEAPSAVADYDIQWLVNFAKMFKAPKCIMWNYGHGAQVLVLPTRGKTEKEIDAALTTHKPYLLDRTPATADIVAVASARPYFEVATEWFDPDDDRPDPPRPKKGVLRRATATTVVCKEDDYSAVDYNEGAKLQRIEVEVDLSKPLPPP